MKPLPAGQPPSAPKPVRTGARTFGLWLGLVLAFFAVSQFLGGGGSGGIDPQSAEILSWLPPAIVAGMFLVVFGVSLLRGRKLTNRLCAALALLARGDVAEAESAFANLASSKQPLIRSQACFWLATLAERRGDFARALELCDAGLAALPKQLRAQTADILFPGLLALRACILAALDQPVEAESELLALRQHYPWFPSITKAVFATRLRALIRAGEIAGAADLAASRSPTLPLTAEEELLADAAMLVAGTPGATPLALFRERLDAWPDGASWLERSAPTLYRRLAAA